MSTARVDFTRGAAERIASVVRRVEQGDRDGAPLSFARVLDDAPSRNVQLAYWTGAWGVNQTHEVTMWSNGKTAVAINRYFGFKPATYPFQANGEGIVVKGGGYFSSSWILACFSLDRVDNFLEVLPTNETVQFLGHAPGDEQGGPFLKWYSVTTCEASQ